MAMEFEKIRDGFLTKALTAQEALDLFLELPDEIVNANGDFGEVLHMEVINGMPEPSERPRRHPHTQYPSTQHPDGTHTIGGRMQDFQPIIIKRKSDREG